MIVTDQNISWPIIHGPGGSRSLRGDLLNTMQSFGAGLLYFDPRRDIVWVAFDGARFLGHVVRMTGNDPVTLERKLAFVSIPENPRSAAELHISLNNALHKLAGL